MEKLEGREWRLVHLHNQVTHKDAQQSKLASPRLPLECQCVPQTALQMQEWSRLALCQWHCAPSLHFNGPYLDCLLSDLLPGTVHRAGASPSPPNSEMCRFCLTNSGSGRAITCTTEAAKLTSACARMESGLNRKQAAFSVCYQADLAECSQGEGTLGHHCPSHGSAACSRCYETKLANGILLNESSK